MDSRHISSSVKVECILPDLDPDIDNLPNDPLVDHPECTNLILPIKSEVGESDLSSESSIPGSSTSGITGTQGISSHRKSKLNIKSEPQLSPGHLEEFIVKYDALKSNDIGDVADNPEDLLESDLPFVCTINDCGERFKLQIQLKQHRKVCQKMLPCPECGKECKDKNSLKMHDKNVHQKRSFFCDVCGKAFAFNSELQKHKRRVHSDLALTGKRTVKCPKCGNMFRDQEGLKTHLREVHTTKTVKCGECGKSYKSQGVLNKHNLRVHMGEEYWKFECEKCGKKFPFCEDLKNHWWSHNTEKVLTCQFCDLTFSHPNGLRCHVNSKHKKSKVQNSGRK